MSAYIFGNGGHAHVIAAILEKKYSTIDFVTPDGDRGTLKEKDFLAQAAKHKKASIYLGVGDNAARTRLFALLLKHGLTPAICIGEQTFVAKNAEIGAGAVICPGAIIQARAHLGKNTIVNTLSSVDHDCALGDHGQLTAGVILGGTTKIGKGAFFGIKSATVPNISLGDNVTVMAGSLVTKNFGSNLLLGGYPAAILREMGEGR